jgi:hypothetical protein
MAVTYNAIATTTLSATATTVTFSSITSSFTDLILVMSYGNLGGADIVLRFNQVTSAYYNFNAFTVASNTSPVSQQGTDNFINPRTPGGQTTSPSLALLHLQVFDYTSDKFKNTISDHAEGSAAGFASRASGTWQNTSAVNRIDIFCNAGSETAVAFVTSSVFTLYGITKA